MSPGFSREEFADRVAKARAVMREAGAELLLIDHAELLAWLTGYTVSETMYRAAFLPSHSDPWFVLRDLDAGPCRDACWFSDIVGFPDTVEPHAVMASEIRRRGFAAAQIGADHASYGFTAATRDRLGALLPQARFTDLPQASDLLRAVKSPAEIALIAQAAGIADKAMAAIAERAQPGAVACEIDAVLREAVLGEGLRPVYNNVTGYTLGLYGRTSRPSDFSRVFLPNAHWRLEEGMVFHMYVSAGGLGFSETIMIEAEGCRRLNSLSRRLLSNAAW